MYTLLSFIDELAVIERLFWQLGHVLVAFAVKRGQNKSECMDCPWNQKKWPL